MHPLSYARRALFFSVDRLDGGRVKRHLAEVRRLMEGGRTAQHAHQQQQLQRLLAHARSTVPYYASTGPHWRDFPVVNKNSIRREEARFLSSAFPTTDLLKTTTSGSTGTPFTVFLDKNKKARNTADTLYFASRTNYRLGDRLYYLKIWSASNRKSRLGAFAQNVVMSDVLLMDDAYAARVVKAWKAESGPFAVIGYASAIEHLCRYLSRTESAPLRTAMSSAIAISETLSDETKETFQRYFGVPLVSRYSNLENGIIAQTCPKFPEYHINSASYLVEILRMDRDEPVEPGTSGRIVLTDLYNFGMPFIRYDTGDVGTLQAASACDFDSPVLSKVEGRKLDLLYDTQGRLVSSLLVYKNMWQYEELLQYQLVQTGKKDYLLRLNPATTFTRSDQITREFRSFFGPDAVINIEIVDDIPLLASGKRRKVVNMYYK